MKHHPQGKRSPSLACHVAALSFPTPRQHARGVGEENIKFHRNNYTHEALASLRMTQRSKNIIKLQLKNNQMTSCHFKYSPLEMTDRANIQKVSCAIYDLS